MPTLSNLKATTDKGINEIRAIRLTTAERIKQGSTMAHSRVEWASCSKANA
jgi:hypothetical protein